MRYYSAPRRVLRGVRQLLYPRRCPFCNAVLAELAFGSEVRMRGAEPVPQRVEGAQLGYDCIVPVPASSRRRGYNVPERMAQPLAEALDLPLETKALGPARRKNRQAGLPFEQRLANVAGAFRVQDPDLIEGRRVLLVDDVITTGATAAACAQALLSAGAESVFAVAVATVEFPPIAQPTLPLQEDADEEI